MTRCSTSLLGRAGDLRQAAARYWPPCTRHANLDGSSWWPHLGCSCNCCYPRDQWFVKGKVALISSPCSMLTRRFGNASRHFVNLLLLGTYTVPTSNRQPTNDNVKSPHKTCQSRWVFLVATPRMQLQLLLSPGPVVRQCEVALISSPCSMLTRRFGNASRHFVNLLLLGTYTIPTSNRQPTNDNVKSPHPSLQALQKDPLRRRTTEPTTCSAGSNTLRGSAPLSATRPYGIYPGLLYCTSTFRMSSGKSARSSSQSACEVSRPGRQSQELPKIADCARVVDELWSRYVMAAKTC